MTQIMLNVQKLEVAYGGINAVKGIDLTVGRGELVALIGANGAGKTSTLKALCGLLKPKAGRIDYDGSEVTGKPAYHLVRRGLAMVPEGRGMFPRIWRWGRISTPMPRPLRGISNVPTRCFRGWRNAAHSSQVHCRGASSRCWQ